MMNKLTSRQMFVTHPNGQLTTSFTNYSVIISFYICWEQMLFPGVITLEYFIPGKKKVKLIFLIWQLFTISVGLILHKDLIRSLSNINHSTQRHLIMNNLLEIGPRCIQDNHSVLIQQTTHTSSTQCPTVMIKK